MFFRVKRTRGVDYLQLVANERHGPQVQQRVLASLGRLDDLRMSGELQRLVDAGAMLSGDGLLLIPPFSNARLELLPDSQLEDTLLSALLEDRDRRRVLTGFHADDPALRRLLAAVAFGALEAVGRDGTWSGPLVRLGQEMGRPVPTDTAPSVFVLEAVPSRDGEAEPVRLSVRVAGGRAQVLRGLVLACATTRSGRPVAAALWSAHVPPVKAILDTGTELARRLGTTDIVLVLDQSFSSGSFLPALGKLTVPFVVPVRQPPSRIGEAGIVGMVAHDVRPPTRPHSERGRPTPVPDPQLRYVQIVDQQAAQRDWRLRTAQLDRVHSTIEAVGGASGGQGFQRLDQARRELVDGERWDGTAIVATNITGPAIEVARIYLAQSASRDWEDELADFGQRLLDHDISPRETGAMLAGGAFLLLAARYVRHELLATLGERLHRTVDWEEFKTAMQSHRSVRISQGERSVTLAPEPPAALRALLDAVAVPQQPPDPGPPRRPLRRRPMPPIRAMHRP